MNDASAGSDDRLPEQFLVDGVAPPVIGGGPEVDHQYQPPPDSQDPPTAPIPAAGQAAPAPKKSWLSRMFGGRTERPA